MLHGQRFPTLTVPYINPRRGCRRFHFIKETFQLKKTRGVNTEFNRYEAFAIFMVPVMATYRSI